MKILLLGKNGQLGSELFRRLPSAGQLKACIRRDVDLEKPETVLLILEKFRPEIIINAAAYTSVDGAEIDPDLAFRVNGQAVKLLAEEAARRNIWLIHYSTDYVFDGQKDSAYREVDVTNPINVYGKSKLAGERAIRNVGCKHIIFRTSWIIGRDGKNFAKSLLKFAEKDETLKIVNDQFGAPTSPKLIAKVTLDAITAIQREEEWPTGLYHIVPKGKTTWFGVATALKEILYISNEHSLMGARNLQAISSSDYASIAERPRNSCLNTDRLERCISFNLPHWIDDFSGTVNKIISEMKLHET